MVDNAGVITGIGRDKAGKMVIEINNAALFVSDEVKEFIQKHPIKKGDTGEYRVKDRTLVYFKPGALVTASKIKEVEASTKINEGLKPGLTEEDPTRKSTRPVTVPDRTKNQPPAPAGLDPSTRVKIELAIRVGSYESLKVGVDGLASQQEQLIHYLTRTLNQFGKDQITRELIGKYAERVMPTEEVKA